MKEVKLKRTNGIAVTYRATIDGEDIGIIALQDDGTHEWWAKREGSGFWSYNELKAVMIAIDALDSGLGKLMIDN